MATEYDASSIKTMSVDYVKRMYDASLKSVNGVDLKNEFLVMKLSKADLEYLLKPSECEGVLCIFGLEGGDQTVTLIPHDSNDKALPIDTTNEIKGIQDWDGKPPRLQSIVFPNNPNNEEISLGVTNVLTNLGIV